MTISRVLTAASAAVILSGALSACAVTDVHQSQSQALPANARWAALPMVNNSEAPQAGERAEAMLSTLLRKHGISDLTSYPAASDASGLPELNEQKRLDDAMKWAASQKLQYGVSGSVSEWQYKTGLDGEPAVGLTVQVVDLSTGKVVWTASGADSGWGYGSLSGTAQTLLTKLLSSLPVQ